MGQRGDRAMSDRVMLGQPATAPEDAACRGCHGLDRREFLGQSLLAAMAGVLAGCGIGGPTTATFTPLTVRLADYPSLATVGGIAVVDDGRSSGVPVAVTRTGDSAFVALSLVCPHRGSTVQSLGSSFMCPAHGAQFSSNGTWTGGQPTSSLGRYAVQYNASAGTLAIS
jgi:nitrite reductase/ring-hydroxylating ferredoxin subunit